MKTAEELRNEWLDEHSTTEFDVLDDDENEYIIVEEESDHSDTYQIDRKRIDLPDFKAQAQVAEDLELESMRKAKEDELNNH